MEMVWLTPRLRMGQWALSSSPQILKIHSASLRLCQLDWGETNPLKYFWDNLFHGTWRIQQTTSPSTSLSLLCLRKNTQQKHKRGRRNWPLIKRQTAMTDSFAQCCSQTMQDLTNVSLGLASLNLMRGFSQHHWSAIQRNSLLQPSERKFSPLLPETMK